MTTIAELVLTALTDVDELARRFAAGDTAESVLLALLRHRSTDVRHAVASCPAASGRVLATAALDAHSSVRQVVAGRQDTPVATLVALAGDDDRSVIVAVAGNATTPTEVIDHLSRRAIEEVRMVAARTTSTPERIEALAADRSPVVRSVVATRPDLPPTLGHRLARDPDEQVRAQLAEHSQDPTVLAHLAGDVTAVASILAGRPDLAPDLAAVLLGAGWPVRVRLATNEHADRTTLTRLGSDRSVRVRRAVLANPAVPDRVLHHALSSRDLASRRLARAGLERRGVEPTVCRTRPNPGDDLGAVLTWVETTDRFVDLASFVAEPEWPLFARRTALMRVPLPPEVFEAAASTVDVELRRDAARHRLCPRPVLERLATDVDADIRRTATARLAA